MHGPALPVPIFVGLYLVEARVLAEDRIHTSILAPGEAAVSMIHFEGSEEGIPDLETSEALTVLEILGKKQIAPRLDRG